VRAQTASLGVHRVEQALVHVDDDENGRRHHGLPREVFFSSQPNTEDTIPGSTRRFRTSPQCEAPSILT
jgi:hypothetical protein